MVLTLHVIFRMKNKLLHHHLDLGGFCHNLVMFSQVKSEMFCLCRWESVSDEEIRPLGYKEKSSRWSRYYRSVLLPNRTFFHKVVITKSFFYLFWKKLQTFGYYLRAFRLNPYTFFKGKTINFRYYQKFSFLDIEYCSNTWCQMLLARLSCNCCRFSFVCSKVSYKLGHLLSSLWNPAYDIVS